MIERLAEVSGRAVSRETFEKLDAFAAMLREENAHQNLVSPSTIESLWERHILDSAQLVRFQPDASASWVDLGSGAGLPGIVVACLVDAPCTLVEPRRLRADFLHRAVESLRIGATVRCCKAERVGERFGTITARALAPLPHLLQISHHLSTGNSRWVLPKGRIALSELAEAKRTWQGVFHVERSVTDPSSFIVVGTGVRAKAS